MFLWKCQRVWDRKYLNLRGTRTFNLRVHAECSNHLSGRGQTFAVPCFFFIGCGGIDIFEVKLTLESWLWADKKHSFSKHERAFLWKWNLLRQKMSQPDGYSSPHLSDSCRVHVMSLGAYYHTLIWPIVQLWNRGKCQIPIMNINQGFAVWCRRIYRIWYLPR